MKRLSASQSTAVAIAFLLAGVFAGAKAYIPAASWTRTPDHNPFLPAPPSEPASRGASVDPALGTVSAACIVAAVLLYRNRN